MEKFDWAEEIGCGVTVSDLDSVVIYQNKRARKIFESYGNLIGKNLKDCHGAKSWEMIQRFLETGESNSYTIEKNGVKKLIHQTPWMKDGKIAGLVEFSIEIPFEMPHFVRK
ncbi:MAG: PAS sensor protein [Bacteroidales bacterium]|jgi:DUF438 domain-containing protein